MDQQEESREDLVVSPGVTIVDSNPRSGQALKSDVEAAKDASTDDQDNPTVIVG